MTIGKLEISGGFALALALLYYLDGDEIVPWALTACAAHELGHWWVIQRLGGRVTRMRLSCSGAELKLSAARPLSSGRMILAALAGPAINFALAGLAARLARLGAGERLYLFAGLNLGLGCFNLLPAGCLDGGRVLHGLFAVLGLEDTGGRVVRLCSIGAAALLSAVGACLLWQSGGRNFTLLAASLWMWNAALREERQGNAAAW